MSNPELERATSLLKHASEKALASIRRKYKFIACDPGLVLQRHLTLALEKIVSKLCWQIVEASKQRPSSHRHRFIEAEKRARNKLACDLRSARQRLWGLKISMELERAAALKVTDAACAERRKQYAIRLLQTRSRLNAIKASIADQSKAWAHRAINATDQRALMGTYPEVPHPTFSPHREGHGLPATSGIYFFWEDDKIAYVGRSKNISTRVRLGLHHILEDHHKISFVFVPEKETTWAECFYIGALKPYKNFGANASHYEKMDS